MNYNKLLRFIVILLLIVINLYFFKRISFETGRIILSGDANELAASEEVRKAYLGG